MQHRLPARLATGAVIAGAAVLPVTPTPTAHAAQFPVQLTSGDGTTDTGFVSHLLDSKLAEIMGPSTIPTPTDGYMDQAQDLYLGDNAFKGTLNSLTTPEGLNPVTGPKSLPFDTSTAQGESILINSIKEAVANGTATPDHPLTVFGWSQSATISSLVMPELAKNGIDPRDVQFVLVGDPNNPNGGMLSRFAVEVGGTHTPSAPALGITFSGATPDGSAESIGAEHAIAHTDIITNEYDGFADFPKYPINLLSDLNAYLGILFQHLAYLGDPEVQQANLDNAILLPGSEHSTTAPCTDGCTTDYWMVPDKDLPLLQWLNYLPFVGKPVYDLLEPDMRILVNLGYGSIDNGWSPGPANELSTFGILPTDSADFHWSDVLPALGKGLQTGVTDFFHDVTSPSNWSLTDYADGLKADPFLNTLLGLTGALDLSSAHSVDTLTLANALQLGVNGLHDNLGFPTSDASIFHSSFNEIVNSITGTLSGDYATLLPLADTANTLLTTFPALLASFVAENLDNPVQGIGEALGAGVGLIPFALIFGAGVPIVSAIGGTAINLAELVGVGDLANWIADDGPANLSLDDLNPVDLAQDFGAWFDNFVGV